MDTAKLMRLDWLPDPRTDARLLPGHMRSGDNRRRMRHLRSAAAWAMTHLKPEQQKQIYLFYGMGLRKNQIAQQENLSNSAVSKTIRNGEDKLREYAALYMEIYDRLEQEFLQDEG